MFYLFVFTEKDCFISFYSQRSIVLFCLFLQAVAQMEERLQEFINTNSNMSPNPELAGDGTARFVHHQVVEIASDCLSKSKEKMISSAYFYELSEKLDRLLGDVS